MQVMNNDQFSQNEVLVGQVAKTRGFAVSDDPMLMSMLSTGFYANPLRTMIQEVMFNAWDAHRMGECLDKPIDIYINRSSGLMIRDYGPGIHDDDIHPVYCVYGASTKRQDKRQTGGFGLGCKSPFAYTESFTVTSHHKHMKAMYLISRVSDDNEGKPGLTTLVKIPTTETGLLVIVPLDKNDLRRAYRYVKDVLYLSGIKANIHYDLYQEDQASEKDIELIESRELRPSECIVTSENTNDHNSVYAVYGGVRYAIPDHDEYTEELNFMKIIAKDRTAYIGFAPDTLSPLPNREGLNMSGKTKENIRVGLELAMERFQETIDPLVHAYFRSFFDFHVNVGIQAHFAIYSAFNNHGSDTRTSKLIKQLKEIPPPLNLDKPIWDIAITLLERDVNTIINLIGQKRWVSIILRHFIRCYPENKNLAFMISKQDPKDLINTNCYNSGSHHLFKELCELVQPVQLKVLNDFEIAFEKTMKSKGFSRPDLRLYNDKWSKVVRHRLLSKKRLDHLTRAQKEAKLKGIENNKTIYHDPYRIWNSHTNPNSDPIECVFINNTVIIAKTLAALNDTSFNIGKCFSNDTSIGMGTYLYSKSYGVIPAYVIHQRHGGYDAALSILQGMGFDVIEADEPEKKDYVSAPKKVINQYPRVTTSKTHWKGDDIDPDDRTDGLTPLTDPTHYLYIKASSFESYYSSDKPSKEIVAHVMNFFPDIAMVTTQNTVDALVRRDVKPFSDALKQTKDTLTSNVYRSRNMVRVLKFMDKGKIPTIMLHNQDIQLALGIAKIKPDDTKFWQELHFINSLANENYYHVRQLQKETEQFIRDTFNADPMKNKINETIKKTLFFSESGISQHWSGLKPEDRPQFAKVIARNIRAF